MASSLRSFILNPRSFRSTSASNCASRSTCTCAPRWFSSTRARLNDETKQNKPKAATPLRRKAADSLPIRANPTPTRGAIRPVLTLTTAERYNLPVLARILPAGSCALQDAYWVPKWRQGEIFVFGNGSTVSWGLEEAELDEFRAKFIAKANIEVERLPEPETEDLEFVTDPNEDTRLQGDLIILGQQPALEDPESLPAPPPDLQLALPVYNLGARYAYSQALARSTALSALETALDEYLAGVATMPHNLARTGKPGLSQKQLMVKLGQLLKFRQGLNLNAENFSDTPELYWIEPAMEAYFNRLSDALEIKQRVAHMNNKITYASEVQATLRELITTSSSHRMEEIIILLIFVEVVMVITLNWRDLRDALFNRQPEQDSETPARRRH
ncbi:hypothetical protein BKA62DRAFT_743179 [Auriculariales sp. MPI-PUGE-AT-0066]|nr:hypothetical protein BKA62DRAFT_743179 [Auriculariales sp. MPI-PUGE-AT-0066]